MSAPDRRARGRRAPSAAFAFLFAHDPSLTRACARARALILTQSLALALVFAPGLFLAVGAAWPPAAAALVIDAGDGRRNTEPPPYLAGWANVGRRLGGPSVVYLGRRWILTAAHVGAGVVELAGERFDPVPGTLHRIRNDDGSETDLLLFRLARDPGLPPLRIAERTPRVGEDVVLVGMGASRGESITVDLVPTGLSDGFLWIEDGTKRWGTNTVSGVVRPVHHGRSYTLALPTVFDRIDDVLGTPEEATAAHGDSGGALFARRDPFDPASEWVLAGILFSVTRDARQPEGSSLYGGLTYAADLATYRDRVRAVAAPACANGRDDDGDGRIDHPEDGGCAAPTDEDEAGDGPAWRRPAVWSALGFATLLAWRVAALWRARGPDGG